MRTNSFPIPYQYNIVCIVVCMCVDGVDALSVDGRGPAGTELIKSMVAAVVDGNSDIMTYNICNQSMLLLMFC